MAKNTPIEWTDHSWPVLNGCRRKSEGCRNCYAERLTATRLRNTPKYQGLAVYTEGGPRWTGESRLWLPDLEMPLKLCKPSRIFVADMGDLFFEGNSNEDIAAVFGVMAACPRHTFQVLTKRPERAAEWFKWIAEQSVSLGGPKVNAARGVKWYAWQHVDKLKVFDIEQPWVWPLPNVHLGVSVEDKDTLAERAPLLRQLPAEVRFLSVEPLLEEIDVSPWLTSSTLIHCCMDVAGALRNRSFDGLQKEGRSLTRAEAKVELEAIFASGVRVLPMSDACDNFDDQHGCGKHQQPGLDWVIVGGESGPGARPFQISWARSIVKQCATANVACFVKQLGAAPWLVDERVTGRLALKDGKGGDMSEWPDDLRVRQFPEVRS